MNLASKIRENVGNALMKFGSNWGTPGLMPPMIADFVGDMTKQYSMHYDAATQDRTRSDWSTKSDVPYNDIKADLCNMIARSRRSADNNPLSNNIDEVTISHVVGEGIRPEPMVSDGKGDPVIGINKALAEGWKRFNDQWDVTRKSTYYGIQELGLRTISNSGSVMAHAVRADKGNFLPVAFEFVEPDRLDFSKDYNTPTKWEIKPDESTQFGIVLNKNGVPQRFWIKGVDIPVSSDFMDIRYRRRRAQQFIGVPWKAPVLKALFDQDSLIEDKSISSRIQTMISLWMNKEDMGTFTKKVNSSNQLKWEAGRIMYSNTKPEVITSGENINETFDPMTRLLSRFVALGMGMSYQTLTRDLVGMNFASSRANILEDRKYFRRVQRFFVKEFCQLDWNYYVYWMFAAGKIPGKGLSDFMRDPWKYTQVHWQTPGWEWVDPLKDAQAHLLMWENGMITLKEIYSKLGKSWEPEVRQWAKERAVIQGLKKQFGVQDSSVKPNEDDDEDDDSNGKTKNMIDQLLESV